METSKGAWIETAIDADGTFLNDSPQLTKKDPSSETVVTGVNGLLLNLSLDHKRILITTHLQINENF